MIRLFFISTLAAIAGLSVLGFSTGVRGETCRLPLAHERFEGVVVRVVDGDTLVLRAASCSALHVRLANLDAPELKEPGGLIAATALIRLAHLKQASCIVSRGRSGNYRSYGRAMAKCAVDGRDLGDSLRAAGVKEGGR